MTLLSSPFLYPLLAVALIVISAILIAFYLYRYSQQLKSKENTLNKLSEQQSKEITERQDKLYNITNQLYEEIAKHEITEELLKETQDYLQSIINSMPSILIGVNRRGNITHWNKAAQIETQISHNDALGKPLFTMIDIEGINLSTIETAIDSKQAQRREAIQDGHGSNARYKDITIYPLHTLDSDSAVIRIDDITSRIRLENMIIQNEKMGSLGELAAGVAHEINNPLSTILQGVQNIQRRLSDDLPQNTTLANELDTDLKTINSYLEQRQIISFIEGIKEAGERAAKIVTNMLEFSRSHTNRDTIDIAELLDRSVDLSLSATSALKSSDMIMSISRDFSDNIPLIYGSAVEIQQVILNLLSNAYHAFLAVEEQELPHKALQIDITLRFTDNQVVIVIKDNGPGMDEWTQRHIFDPFFTTKEVGKVTGLGLSVSYFIIVEHHKGSINVDSEVGKGTQFTIYLPVKQ